MFGLRLYFILREVGIPPCASLPLGRALRPGTPWPSRRPSPPAALEPWPGGRPGQGGPGQGGPRRARAGRAPPPPAGVGCHPGRPAPKAAPPGLVAPGLVAPGVGAPRPRVVSRVRSWWEDQLTSPPPEPPLSLGRRPHAPPPPTPLGPRRHPTPRKVTLPKNSRRSRLPS